MTTTPENLDRISAEYLDGLLNAGGPPPRLFTVGYATLLAKEGITANAIAPALIATEMVTQNPNARPDLIPLGRLGTFEEVAAVAVLLARNGYITGQTISVNGGWYMS